MPGGNKVVRIKPLKDSMVKEAAYYCHLRRIETSNWNGWDGFVPLDVAGGQAGGNARKAVGDSRGKGGVNSLERLTEGERAPRRRFPIRRRSWLIMGSTSIQTLSTV
jgi:hypothetical protein